MEHPYADISDSERIERDWQAEERAQARFLRETYTYWETEFRGVPRSSAEFHGTPKQLNLFEEVR